MLLPLWLALASVGARAEDVRFQASVLRVIDGDTVWLQPETPAGGARHRPLRLRLVGLDAPEICQAHGSQARAALTARALHRRVEVRRRATDVHGRALGTLWLDDQDLGAWLVLRGHAWSDAYHGDPGPYAAEERQARAARRGLFTVPNPLRPREFRHRHGRCESPPETASR